MVGGGVTVVLWKVLISKLGGIFSVYELLPAFIVSCLCIYIVSKVTAEPSKEIYAEFEEYKRMMKEQ